MGAMGGVGLKRGAGPRGASRTSETWKGTWRASTRAWRPPRSEEHTSELQSLTPYTTRFRAEALGRRKSAIAECSFGAMIVRARPRIRSQEGGHGSDGRSGAQKGSRSARSFSDLRDLEGNLESINQGLATTEIGRAHV